MLRKIVPDIAAIVVAAAIVYLSLSPGLKVTLKFVAFGIGSDKYFHALFYGCLGFCALYRRYEISHALLTALVLLLYGILVEYIQSQVGRKMSVDDVVANGIGLLLSWILVLVIRSIRHGTQTRIYGIWVER